MPMRMLIVLAVLSPQAAVSELPAACQDGDCEDVGLLQHNVDYPYNYHNYRAKYSGNAGQPGPPGAAGPPGPPGPPGSSAQLKDLEQRVSDLEKAMGAQLPGSPGGQPQLPAGPPGGQPEQCRFVLDIIVRAPVDEMKDAAKVVKDELALAGVKESHIAGDIGFHNALSADAAVELEFSDVKALEQAKSALDQSMSRVMSAGKGEYYRRGNAIRAATVPPFDKCPYYKCYGRNFLWNVSYSTMAGYDCLHSRSLAVLQLAGGVQHVEDKWDDGKGRAGFTYVSNSKIYGDASTYAGDPSMALQIKGISQDPKCNFKLSVEPNPACPTSR